MKTYNYTNWKNYLIHLLNEKKSQIESLLNTASESFLNTASQAEVYIALDKGDLIDEREAEKFRISSQRETLTLHETSRRKKRITITWGKVINRGESHYCTRFFLLPF